MTSTKKGACRKFSHSPLKCKRTVSQGGPRSSISFTPADQLDMTLAHPSLPIFHHQRQKRFCVFKASNIFPSFMAFSKSNVYSPLTGSFLRLSRLFLKNRFPKNVRLFLIQPPRRCSHWLPGRSCWKRFRKEIPPFCSCPVCRPQWFHDRLPCVPAR